MNDTLQMSLLGPVVIRQSHQEVTGFRSRKASALLIYLACSAGAQRREALADLLWADCAPQQALSNLRTTLVHLRDRLGDCLQSTHGSLSMNPRLPCWVDAVEVQRQLAALIPNQHTPLASAAVEPLEKVLRLYQGDFLAGFHVQNAPYFEEWALLEGERLRRMTIEGYQRLTAFYLAQADYKAGLRSVDRWLTLDRLDETGHSQRMYLLAADGQRAAALAQYETCRRILDDDLGVEPVEQTTQLYELVRTGQLEHQPASPLRLTATPAAPAEAPTPQRFNTLPSSLTRFIGRQAELDNIAECLANPGCRLLTIVGLRGMGKTALALQAAAAAQFADGVCYVPIPETIAGGDIARVIADALRLSLDESGRPHEQLFAYLRQKQLLLLLDNLEYLRGDTAFVTSLLQHAPAVKVLGASIEPLNQRAEWLLPLHGLPAADLPIASLAELPALIPPSASDPDGSHSQPQRTDHATDALHLFVLRARQVQPQFNVALTDVPAILRICRLVDGMPLAIEMAAEWVGSLSCHEIAEELEQDPTMLTSSRRDVPARHQSLEAIFAHTRSLLSPTDIEVLQNVARCRHRASREVVQQVTGASLATLAALVQKSFLWRTSSGQYETSGLLCRYVAHSLPQMCV
jgi:predicted ATPase/DNA-binding SARP family transcriptional activator